MSRNLKKRSRERSTADSERAEIFEDLAQEDKEIRMKAATRLLKRLQDDRIDGDVDIFVRRLFRGLCSSRKAARLGFGAALTEVLSQHAGSKVATTIDLWLELTEASGQMDGQESRDHVMGRVFGAVAVLQSGILFLDSNDQTHWKRLLDAVFDVANKRAWMREECGWVTLLGLQKAKTDKLGQEWADTALQAFCDHGLGRTSEGVALWISAERLFPTLRKPSTVFEDNDPLSFRNRSLLLRILREETLEKDADAKGKQSQKSSWSARPHFAWDIIFNALPEERYSKFWREVVDGGLFAQKSSRERKHWGLSILCQQITSLPSHRVPAVFTPNLCRCLDNQIAETDRYLHFAADRSLETIIKRAEVDPTVIAPLLLRFTEDDVRSIFATRRLKSKLVDVLIKHSNIETVSELSSQLSQLQETRNKNASPILDPVRLDILQAMMRTQQYPSDTAELAAVRVKYKEVIVSLVEASYFGRPTLINAPTSKLSEKHPAKNEEQLRSRLWSCLTVLIKKDPSPEFYLQGTIEAIKHLEERTGNSCILNERARASVKKGISEALARSQQEDLRRDASKRGDAVKTLLCACILQVYNEDADAVETLDDLVHAYGEMKNEKEFEKQEQASDAVIEIVLSLISKPPVLLKNIAQHAFFLFTDFVTEGGLRSMLAILEARENVAGQNDMFESRDEEDRSGDDDDDDDDYEEGDGGDKDVIMDDGERQDAGIITTPSGDEDSAESSDEGSEESSEDEGADEIEEFDAKLAQALGTRKLNTNDLEANSDSSESDMDDEQMEALDEHLTLMFKQRAQAENSNKRKEAKEAKENISVFKSRVLDLLRIFVDEQPGRDLSLEILVPLLALIHSTRVKAVAGKASDVLQAYAKRFTLVVPNESKGRAKAASISVSSSQGKGNYKPDSHTMKRSEELLRQVHESALEQGSHRFQAACSKASLLLVKIYLSNGGRFETVAKRYQETRLTSSKTENCGLESSFFMNWENWRVSVKDKLDIIDQ